ncbi:hypothetical protein H310_09923 [Aphanomyces invadans]|uniref:VWFA domain-containing protein n=1 Tax=Aphanomyces invadans TaxID=157072 RepID=A0A024TSX4_9STRA|nr:hypothetical protein H310_09923 [Aphanomyces invadans]ETV97114.1 hypothetical protein H310_09923 [Aphanomyces invadans]|eukprot:XP_008874360.1 hypothetical protein H310_09923 [Aphanomyces invadans]
MSPYTPVPVPATPSPNAGTSAIAITSTAERREIAASVATTTFVNCHLAAPAVLENQRKPVDLVVVLDRSGSMHGDKLALCKRTMDFLAHQLAPHDRVSLVSYDSDVTTDMPLTKMNDQGKANLAQKVKCIQAGSCTNLSGGLVAGVEEVQRPTRLDNGEPNPVQSVLLLTDGQANEGVTGPDSLAKLLGELLGPQVSLHTFGYGSDHNATLLGRLADIGRGSYYFIQNVDGVALAFARCLGGLLSVVGQNIKLEVVASPGALIASVKTKRPVMTVADKVHVEIDLGDMFAEESRDVLVEVQLTPQVPSEKMEIVEFRVRYVNVLQSTMEKETSVVTIGRPARVEHDDDDTVDEVIVAQKLRIAAVEAIESAQAEANKGNLDQGKRFLRSAIELVQRDMATLSVNAQATMAILLADLDECTVNMASQSVYQSRGQGRTQQKIQTHWMQRQNNVEVEEDCLLDCDDGFVKFCSSSNDDDEDKTAPRRQAAAPAPAPGGYAGIGNAMQRQMMKKAFKVTK